jgi:hypothetical protein
VSHNRAGAAAAAVAAVATPARAASPACTNTAGGDSCQRGATPRMRTAAEYVVQCSIKMQCPYLIQHGSLY